VENRLRSVTGGPSSVTLDYDAFGRLGTVTTGGAATHYRYAGAQLAAESSGGVLLRSHVSGQGVDEQWMSFEGTGAAASPNWYLQDRQNSVIGVSDASGAITPYAYGPYGEPQSWSGSRFRYTGQIAIPEAQLYHYRARAYDPVMGRFLQTDPIGYDDGPNIYAYVGGDPVNGSDPSGLEKETDVTEVEELVIPAPRREGEGGGGRGGGHREVQPRAPFVLQHPLEDHFKKAFCASVKATESSKSLEGISKALQGSANAQDAATRLAQYAAQFGSFTGDDATNKLIGGFLGTVANVLSVGGAFAQWGADLESGVGAGVATVALLIRAGGPIAGAQAGEAVGAIVGTSVGGPIGGIGGSIFLGYVGGVGADYAADKAADAIIKGAQDCNK
jgi:RHS repeat-associated protein